MIKKRIIFLLTVCFCFSLVGCGAFTVYKSKEEIKEAESWEPISGQDFDDDCVIVVLSAKISKINKVHRKSFFRGVEIESIRDLTWREHNMENPNGTFRQILQIVLKYPSKENVVQAIRNLLKLEGVESAEPNYIYSIDPIY